VTNENKPTDRDVMQRALDALAQLGVEPGFECGFHGWPMCQSAIEALRTPLADQVQVGAEFELWQDDMVVAGSSGPRESALREIHHYTAQYACDGPAQIFEVHRTLIASANGAVAKEAAWNAAGAAAWTAAWIAAWIAARAAQETQLRKVCAEIEGASVLAAPKGEPPNTPQQIGCAGKNCGRTDGTHSDECYAEHDRSIGYKPAQQEAQGELPDEHKAAEQEYSTSAFNYPEAPIGSRDWCLFWDGWMARALLASQPTDEGTKNLLKKLDWYKGRAKQLHRHQSQMRDPERTMVCDILANGKLMAEPNGNRYGQPVQASQPKLTPCRHCGFGVALNQPPMDGEVVQAEPVAYAVQSVVKGGIHKLATTKDSADSKAAKWSEEWPNNKVAVRPLIYGDTVQPVPASEAMGAVQKPMTEDEVYRCYENSHVEYAATVLVTNELTETEQYATEKRSNFSPVKFVRAIEQHHGIGEKP
jgi:hypothetical protein